MSEAGNTASACRTQAAGACSLPGSVDIAATLFPPPQSPPSSSLLFFLLAYLLRRHQIGLVHFNRQRPLDQIERKHQAGTILPPHNDSFHPREWPLDHARMPSYLQVGVRFCSPALFQELPYSLYVLLRHRRRASIEAHQSHYAGNLQNAKPLLRCHVNKDVAREKRQLQAHLAVFPSAHRLILRQEVFDAPARKLVRHTLLVVRACVDG